MTKLNVTEKKQIEALYKCKRNAGELTIISKLSAERDALVEPIWDDIKQHKDMITKLEIKRERTIIEAGYDNIGSYSCGNEHPELNNYRDVTAANLMKLWSGELTTLK